MTATLELNGVGKTFIAGEVIRRVSKVDRQKVLIVVPAALKDSTWMTFLRRWDLISNRVEIVTFDDKIQPSEALIALKSITDQNIPFVLQCIGSNVAAAMLDGVSRNNARNPNNRAVYLNVSALSDEMTEEKCDFWHFRFSANVTMRVATMVKGLPPDIKTVYLMNQDYLYGQIGRAHV